MMIRCGRFKIPSRLCVVILLVTNISLCFLFFLEMKTLPLQEGCSTVPCEIPTKNYYLLVLMVLSSPKGKERRDAIRQTWTKGYREKTHMTLVQFAIGIEGLSFEDKDGLMTEDTTYGDLLLLPRLHDSYNNLTRKVLMSFMELDARYNFSYLMKCDDDTFVVLNTVLSELEQRKSKRSYYWGFFDGRAHVKRSGKWREKKWFLSDRYLPYALGGGYILSHDLVRRIVSNSDGLTLYNSEDVSVGVWLSPYDAERRHDVRFNTEFVSRGCRNVYIASHKQSLDEMLSKQKLLEETGKQCLKEYQTRMSYVYNWTVEPSKCCVRVRGVA